VGSVRELLLRSGARVRFVKLTRHVQISLFSVALGAFLWATAATVISWIEYDRVAVVDAQLKDAQTAYDDLLEEIAIYQRKVAEVTGKLKQNQAEMIGRFAHTDALEQGNLTDSAIEGRAGGRLAAITESRDAMRQYLSQLDAELREITDLDDVLAASLNSIQRDLITAVAERKKVYQARANLNKQVAGFKEELWIAGVSVDGFETKVVDLKAMLGAARSEIDRANAERDAVALRAAEFGQSLDVAATREAELLVRSEEARADLAVARKDYDRIAGERANIEVQAAALQGALHAEEDRANEMEADLRRFAAHLGEETGDPGPHNPARESLSERVAFLLDRLTELHQARSRVIENLKALTVDDIENAERIIGMTGLDVNTLLAKVGNAQELGKGGPFVALVGGVASDNLAGAVHGLDTQLTRLEALKVVLQAVPLVSPVDSYRMASLFGKRRDPMSKKWAIHAGVDLANRSKTKIYTSAPGVVVSAGWNGRYGRMIEIDHGFGIRTRYGHLNKIFVKKGQEVRYREKIGLLGRSGRSTGPHLQYEIIYGTIAMDPLRFIRAGKHVFKE
jgi:murein DD-endopeptidase MepM/ murein hydrolase activator NlpD